MIAKPMIQRLKEAIENFLYPELRPYGRGDRDRLLERASKTPLDAIEWAGIVAALAFVVTLTRAVKHSDFAMASGEMSRDAFITFLNQTLDAAAKASIDGAVHFACMDWRHIEELLTASRSVYGAMLNLIAWVKTNAGQGSFYRSQHELIGVFRVGAAPHLNTIELGRHGRSRSNVWHYAGANTFRVDRMSDLRAHPTVKPIAMIADAIKDCTRRTAIVLDTFCGSGTTILAAERVGRRGYGLEIDPRYVDVAVRRWQAFSGRDALHVGSGLTFEEVGLQRFEKKKASPTSNIDKRGGR
jgi:hypothetical protein